MNWEEYSKNRPKTIFCDIDGTLVEHDSPLETTQPGYKLKLLPGTLEKLTEWDRKCYRIILTTGRRECSRKTTEKQLSEAGIIYDQLLMGISGATRVLINDKKPDGTTETAFAYNLIRNKGIKDLEI
jgi:histidinol phosphatase-like enzyme